MGIDFLRVQEEIQVHFFGLVLAASLFTVGILAFTVNFFGHGKPNDEALAGADQNSPHMAEPIYYVETGKEAQVFEAAHKAQLPVMLKARPAAERLASSGTWRSGSGCSSITVSLQRGHLGDRSARTPPPPRRRDTLDRRPGDTRGARGRPTLPRRNRGGAIRRHRRDPLDHR